MAKIKSIIFDLGGVVFDISFDNIFESWSASSGKPFDDIKNKFVIDEHWNEFERNDISPAEYRKIVTEQIGIKLSDEDFDRGWNDLYLDPYPGIDKILLHLKKHHKLVALTNSNAIHYKVWPARYADTLKHFEKVFSSHLIGTRKPEAKAFQTVLDYLQTKPSETVFLDDNPDNTDGAGKLGIDTIHVKSQEKMREELFKNVL